MTQQLIRKKTSVSDVYIDFYRHNFKFLLNIQFHGNRSAIFKYQSMIALFLFVSSPNMLSRKHIIPSSTKSNLKIFVGNRLFCHRNCMDSFVLSLLLNLSRRNLLRLPQQLHHTKWAFQFLLKGILSLWSRLPSLRPQSHLMWAFQFPSKQTICFCHRPLVKKHPLQKMIGRKFVSTKCNTAVLFFISIVS